MKKKIEIDKYYVLNRVSKGLEYQFEGYTWFDMLDDCGLSPEELTWAKEHICYKAYILD